MKRIIGITGGISSGKSNICNELIKMNYQVIDSDKINHELSQKNKPVYDAIIQTFGTEYLDQDGNIDRKKLAFLVFNNSAAKLVLERATHPIIVSEIKKQISSSSDKMIFIDIPLLFEAKLGFLCDKIICVYVDKETQIKRLIERDHIDYEYALSKINSQMSLEEKKRLSDYTIDTSGSFSETKEKLIDILRRI